MTSAQTPTQSALAEIHGSGGLVGCELSFLSGRVALVRDPAQEHGVLQIHGEGRTVAIRLDLTALAVLGLAFREGALPAGCGSEAEALRKCNGV
jgi:hypothetical protein